MIIVLNVKHKDLAVNSKELSFIWDIKKFQNIRLHVADIIVIKYDITKTWRKCFQGKHFMTFIMTVNIGGQGCVITGHFGFLGRKIHENQSKSK